MAEYRTSAHAVWDIKYHVMWITKYRYKVLRGEVAERARDLIRQICQAREVVIIRGAMSPDHIHMLVSAPPQHRRPSWCSTSRDDRRGGCRRSSRSCENGIGDSTCGRADTFARRWARWTRQRSRSTSKTRSGTKTIRVSRSPRPPSLEPALQPATFRRLQPQPRLSVAKILPAFSR